MIRDKERLPELQARACRSCSSGGDCPSRQGLEQPPIHCFVNRRLEVRFLPPAPFIYVGLSEWWMWGIEARISARALVATILLPLSPSRRSTAPLFPIGKRSGENTAKWVSRPGSAVQPMVRVGVSERLRRLILTQLIYGYASTQFHWWSRSLAARWCKAE